MSKPKTNSQNGQPLKAALRNFTLTPEADAELVRIRNVSGKSMTAVLEDLLLSRRQFSAPVEAWLDAEAARARCRRADVIERTLAAAALAVGGRARK